MSSIFKNKAGLVLTIGSCASVIALMAGCGGGGGGGSSTPSGTPSPFDGVYTPTYVPTDKVAADGKAPTGTLNIVNGRATGNFTFYLQTAVLTNYQPQINKALSDAGYAGEIPNNQIPSSIPFTLTKSLDGSGKAVLTSSKSVKVCGTGTLTVDSTFLATGGGAGTYKLTFPNSFTVSIRRSNHTITGIGNGLYCNNLPNRIGAATFTRPLPTATPIPTATATPAGT